MIEQPTYFAVIPAIVRYDKTLSPFARLMFGEFTCLANRNGYCFASNNYFAELYDVTPQAVSKWIKSLEKKGYIKIEYIYEGKEIKERHIYINVSTHDYGGINVGLKGYQPTIKDNNTRDNNTSLNICKTKKTKKEFIPPSIDEVRQYCREKNYNVDAEQFISYYESNNWKDKNNAPVKNWKLKLVVWSKNTTSQPKKQGSMINQLGVDDINIKEEDIPF